MNNNAVVFPEPKDVLSDYINDLYKKWDQASKDELDIILKLVFIRSKQNLEDLRQSITSIILREKWSELGLEIQRIFREYSFIYS